MLRKIVKQSSWKIVCLILRKILCVPWRFDKSNQNPQESCAQFDYSVGCGQI